LSTNVTTRPQFLNANTNVYTGWDLRDDGPEPAGAGVAGYQDFRVIQRQAGANMSVDVGTSGAGQMTAWVRGNTREGQGLYRVDNIDRSAPSASSYVAQLNVTVSSNASGNPRIDQVVLRVQDSQHAGATNLANIAVVTGTATSGATLDNRNGAAALPASCILLADILVANGASSITTADIRDRRPYALHGVIPGLLTGIDQVAFEPGPGLTITEQVLPAGLGDQQSVALMWLPRRIVGATRIRWRYVQSTGATAATSNYVIAICDASGRPIVNTGSVAFTGSAGTAQEASLTIAATTFEGGWYYVLFGAASVTASSNVWFPGCDIQVQPSSSAVNVAFRNTALRVGGGGITVPATILGLTDLGGATANPIPVPTISLSVG
jgi:hypothetical protein